jgi:hypothetical protein
MILFFVVDFAKPLFSESVSCQMMCLRNDCICHKFLGGILSSLSANDGEHAILGCETVVESVWLDLEKLNQGCTLINYLPFEYELFETNF